MTPEALLVHYADDIDAKFAMMAAILADRCQSRPAHLEEKRPHAAGLPRRQSRSEDWNKLL